MKHLVLTLLIFCATARAAAAAPLQWVTYDGYDLPGYGRHIVLISGDEEYRSEEALSQLGKILATHHGFKCTVLFAQDPAMPGVINPNYRNNIPGLKALREADLMIMATRFRELPDDQMREINHYLLSGRPVVGLRTANHGFRFPGDSKWAHYAFKYDGPKKTWQQGFGQRVLGSYFFSHHGWHGRESTRGLIAPGAEKHPIVNGIADGDIWGASDVYGVKTPLPEDGEVLFLGQVLEGLDPEDAPLGPGPYEKAPDYVKAGGNDKNDPMMPVAWTKSYRLPGGVKGRAFSTTMGASVDLKSEGTRRMIVNGVYWCLGLDVPEEGTAVELVGDFDPTMFGTEKGDYWEKRGLKVADFAMKIEVEDPYLEKKPQYPYLDVTQGREGYEFEGHPRNRFRLYDFYARQADHYLDRPERPEILPEYPGLDGGAFGHWGRFHKNGYRDRRANLMRMDSVFSGILRIEGDRKSPATPRAIALHLGERGRLSASFDTETLRFAHLWRGGFISFFPNRWGIGGGIQSDGALVLESPQVTGWSQDGNFPKAFPEGAAEYHGHYRHGKRAILHYTAHGLEMLDSFWAIPSPGGEVVSRTIEFRGKARAQHLLLFPALVGGFEHKAEVSSRVSASAWSVIRVEKKDRGFFAAAETSAFNGAARFVSAKSGERSLKLTDISPGDRIHVLYWSGPKKRLDPALKSMRPDFAQVELEPLTGGGPAKWDRRVRVTGKPGKEASGPYVIDRIPVPWPNPFGAVMLIGGHDFFSNGDAAVCTMMGDVWRVRGLDRDLKEVTWQRIATGLNQALGLSIVDDTIYVLGRDRINRLHDLNGDGEIDHYENFSDAFETSAGGHDFYTGLQRDGDGHWYFAAAGRVVRVSPDGKTSVDIATGLRNTNGIGVNAEGVVVTNTNEGDWTPTNMVLEVREGDFYGRKAAADQEIDPAMVYLPRGIDNSAGGQSFVDSERWGPLEGQLLTFSYGAGTWYMVVRSETGGRTQGAVVPLPGDFESGAHRGRFNPVDGQLYISGAGGWGNYALAQGSFDRVRYTGGKVHLPIGWKAHANGIVVRFAVPLHPGVAQAADKGAVSGWLCQQWNYEYSAGYGSAEYSIRRPSKNGHDVVPVRSVSLLEDGRSVFVEIPDLLPAMQTQFYARLVDFDGEEFVLDMYPTLLRLADPFGEWPRYARVDPGKPSELTLRIRRASSKKVAATKGEPGRLIEIPTAPGLQFEVKEFTVAAGERISLKLDNIDTLPHNLVIVKPGTEEAVGALANAMLSDPTAFERHYVPDSPDVLVSTSLLDPQRDETIHFNAPEELGVYPYLCTFPGHWMIMRGRMVVE